MLLNQLFSQNAKLMTETAGSVIRSDSVKGPHPHGQQGTSETLNHLDEKVLSPAELNKRDNLTVFLQKLANQEPFVPAGGETPSIIIKVDAETLENIRAGKIPSVFKTADGATIRLSQLEKTTEFGGKPGVTGTEIEDRELASLQAQLQSLKGNAPEIKIKIGDRIVNVSDVVSTPGTPKSDFHFVDSKGNSVAWVSHKDGSKATSFGQWGGLSDREMLPVYAAHPDIKKAVLQFVVDVKNLVGDVMPNATTIARPAPEALQLIAVYGNRFGGPRGPQNVDVVLQGSVTIQNGELVGATSTHSNGDPIKGSYEPSMMAIYKGDRDGFGIKGARFSVYPMGGRKVHKLI